VKDFIAARNVSLNVNNVMKIAEEKFSCVSKEEWGARCMHVKESEEECLKVEPTTDEMSECFVVNLETGSDNRSSGGEMSGVDPLGS
jgi:hypothetical protein